MKEGKRIGIVGWWYGDNFGTTCTYYSLYNIIKELGYMPVMVYPKSKEPLRLPNEIGNFCKEYYNITPWLSPDNINKVNDYCDAFILGSDQLWNYYTNYTHFHMLNFANKDKKKLSYSTSFGHENLFFPPEIFKQARELMRNFDAISVREHSAVKICKEKFGVDSEFVLDPLMCVNIGLLNNLSEKATHTSNQKFVFAYILDPNPLKLNMLKKVANRLNLQMVSITDRQHGRAEKNKILAEYGVIENATTEDLLWYFKNADFVVTDSFHGNCLALKNEKQFISFVNKERGSTRFDTLNALFDIKKVLISNEEIDNVDLYNLLDYKRINQILRNEIIRSVNWLKEVLIMQHKPMCIPEAHYGQTSYLNKNNEPYYICKKGDCTGCSACYNVCPTGAITMEEDNEGFLYPQLTFKDKCINCGKCFRICPVLNPSEKMNANLKPKNIYAAYSLDKDIRFMSTSGGAFSEFAKYVLSKGGVVYGAAYDENFIIQHTRIEKMEDLPKIRQSKYYQSEMGDIFKSLLKDLKQNKEVVFCGSPCQCGGLNAFLGGNAGKKYPNLLIIDFICHSVPSKKGFKSYLNELEEDYGAKAKRVWFKNKQHGWHKFSLRIDFFKKDRYYIKTLTQDNFFKAFLKYRLFLRPCCHKCQFKDFHRDADVTLADFWALNWNNKNNTDDQEQGVSIIMTHTDKAQKIFDEVVSRNMYHEPHTLEDVIKGNGGLIHSATCGMYRDYFFENVDKYKYSEIIKNMDEREAIFAKQRAEQQKVPQIIGKVTKIGNVVIDMKPSSKIIVEDGGELILNYNLPKGSSKETIIMMYENSTIRVKGKFLIAFDSTIKVFGGSHIIFNNGFVNSGAKISAQVNGINFGNDFLGGPEIIVFDYDSHKIVDLETQKVLNPPEPELKIGEHVWLCARAAIFGGVNIGKNSIIAANTVITKDVAENSLVAGSPAKVVKTGVTWKK